MWHGFSNVKTHHLSQLFITKKAYCLPRISPRTDLKWMEHTACCVPHTLLDLPNYILRGPTRTTVRDEQCLVISFPSPALSHLMLLLRGWGWGCVCGGALPPPLHLETLPTVNLPPLSQEVEGVLPKLLEDLPLCTRNYLYMSSLLHYELLTRSDWALWFLL